jgi:hypothetical protein
MALLARLTNGEEPRIGLHGFNSALREYARGQKSRADIESTYSISAADAQWAMLIGLIDAQSGTTNKIIKAIEIGDVLLIREGKDSRPLYPTSASVAARFGL